MGNKRFQKLLEPCHIGSVKIKNRIIKTAAETNYYNEADFHVNETLKEFYEAQARGGAGAVYVEGPAIDYPLGMFRDRGIRIDDDEYIPGLSELTQVIHKHDCAAFLQLVHAGQWHRTRFFGFQPVSASIPANVQFPAEDLPRELTIAEIEDVVDKFASAAVRAQKAGFDGVDINAGAAHLLSTFLSLHWNKRHDEYGCDTPENRARIVVEIIQEVKKRLGYDYPVGVLINGAEYAGDNAQTIEESQSLARIFEQAGATSIQVRSYRYGSFASFWPEQFHYPEPYETLANELDWSHTGAGAYVPLAAAVKEVVSIPVITVGRLDHRLGESVLAEGKADFIGMCRALMADPELPNKVAQGRPEDIAPCTACLTCLDGIALHMPMRCRINAALGKEVEYQITPAKTKKKVMVIGGGPGGMEAARVAALRGHNVTLHEKGRKLGGLLITASLIKGNEVENLLSIIEYLKTQLVKSKVDIRLGKSVNVTAIEEIQPDAVIVASGSILSAAQIPGSDRRNVVNSIKFHQKLKIAQNFLGPQMLSWLTRLWMPVGKKVVIIGGAMQGCELAEFLVKRGRTVTLVEASDLIGEGIIDRKKQRLVEWMNHKKVTILTEARCDEITGAGVIITTKDGTRQTIKADTIVPINPSTPDTEFAASLEGKVAEIHLIGDCKEPGMIADAIADGSRVGHTI